MERRHEAADHVLCDEQHEAGALAGGLPQCGVAFERRIGGFQILIRDDTPRQIAAAGALPRNVRPFQAPREEGDPPRVGGAVTQARREQVRKVVARCTKPQASPRRIETGSHSAVRYQLHWSGIQPPLHTTRSSAARPTSCDQTPPGDTSKPDVSATFSQQSACRSGCQMTQAFPRSQAFETTDLGSNPKARPMPTAAYLTKSRYAAGLQCLLRLWLNVHESAARDEPELGSADDIGLEIGRRAHLLFPGGVAVEETPWEHAAAVTRTAALMADRSVPAIFEAAVEHAGVRVRVDILERRPRGYWGMYEVKSSGDVKDHHYDDAALQIHVLRGAGVRLSSVEILHVNKNYARGLRGISWPKFFRRVDVKTAAKRQLDGIETRLKKQRACLSCPEAPKVEPEAHCHAPFLCEYWQRCTQTKPTDWVFHMPHLSAARRAELKILGVESIAAIPDDFLLSPRQVIIRDALRSGKEFIAEDLSEQLQGFGPPAFYLDFEAFMPVVPLYPSTRPYQVIPFQWSLHHVDADGKITHQEFLAPADSDPRRPFAEMLIAALKGTRSPIIVYSPYEEARLTELAKHFSDLAKPLRSIVLRLADLLPVVRSGVYHPDFDFSSSIKTAAPVLCPDVTYDDLEEIADGGTASRKFWLMASGQTDATTSDRLRRALRQYCQRDTWAMVRLHQALQALAAASGCAN